MAVSGNLPPLPPASGPPNKRSSFPASSFRERTISSGLSVRRARRLHAARQLQHLFLRPSASSLCKAMHHSDYLTKSNRFGRYFLMKLCSILGSKANLFSWSSSSFSYFFSGEGSEKGSGDEEKLTFEITEGNSSNKWNDQLWTNILIVINVLLYGAEILTQGKLMLWGAKVNALIKQGQIWRLVTSSFLHANLMHLMVGSLAVFVLRHRKFIGGGKEEMQQIAHVIALNMIIGVLSRNTDNWGHLGGLLGGVAVSWFVGPAWSYEYSADVGRLVFADKAPLLRFINRKGGNSS